MLLLLLETIMFECSPFDMRCSNSRCALIDHRGNHEALARLLALTAPTAYGAQALTAEEQTAAVASVSAYAGACMYRGLHRMGVMYMWLGCKGNYYTTNSRSECHNIIDRSDCV